MYEHVDGRGSRLIRADVTTTDAAEYPFGAAPHNTIVYCTGPRRDEELRARTTEGLDAPALLAGGNELHSAVQDGDFTRTKKALDRGVDLRARTLFGWTPLHLAAWHGRAEMVEPMLGAHEDANATVICEGVDLGTTPLHLAMISPVGEPAIDVPTPASQCASTGGRVDSCAFPARGVQRRGRKRSRFPSTRRFPFLLLRPPLPPRLRGYLFFFTAP